MPIKHGAQARQAAEKRARRERRQLGREERVREDHAPIGAALSIGGRPTQRSASNSAR